MGSRQDSGGKTYVRLDVVWEMQDKFAECVLDMSALMSPTDAEECLQKFAAFQPGYMTIQNIVDEMGEQLEKHEDVCSLGRFRDNDWPIGNGLVFVPRERTQLRMSRNSFDASSSLMVKPASGFCF